MRLQEPTLTHVPLFELLDEELDFALVRVWLTEQALHAVLLFVLRPAEQFFDKLSEMADFDLLVLYYVAEFNFDGRIE